VFVYEKPDRHFAENLAGARLIRYLSWMRKMEMGKESNDIDQMRSEHLFSAHGKGGDAGPQTVVMEMNRKLSIN
jgi:hypothetical protein